MTKEERKQMTDEIRMLERLEELSIIMALGEKHVK